MKVICAWCEQQGRQAVLMVLSPPDDSVVSHGICDAHAASYKAALEHAMRSEEGRSDQGRPGRSPH